MQSKMYADKNKSGKNMSDDEIKKQKGGKEFLARLKAAKEKMKEEVVTELNSFEKEKGVDPGPGAGPAAAPAAMAPGPARPAWTA